MRNGQHGARTGKIVSGFALAVVIALQTYAGQAQQIQQKLLALEKLPPKLSFVVLGDMRTGDDIYRKIIAMAAARKPDLIVSTGDQITQPGNREQWENFWMMSKPVAIPYFLTVGNHDIHKDVPGSEKTYRDEVDLPGNKLYYSFKAGNALFIVLDSCIKGEENRIAGEQFQWLKGVLARAKQRHRFVFIHHPLFPEPGKGKHAGNSLDAYPEERDRLHALFVKYRITAVFQGHEHVYLGKSVDSIRYITTGGAGAPLYTKDSDGGFHHYIYLSVDGGKISGEVVDIDGKMRDRF